jgi:hypothetical protein
MNTSELMRFCDRRPTAQVARFAIQVGMTPAEVATLVARLNGVIADAQALQMDIQRQTVERRRADRGVPQALGPSTSSDRRSDTKTVIAQADSDEAGS